MSTTERAFWDVEAQTMPRDKLLELQTQRMQEAVDRAYAGSGFYRRRMQAAGVKPGDIVSAAEVAALPPFTKADLRANEAEYAPIGDYRCKGLDSAVRLATSTGTSGRPTFMLWTQHDLTVDYELSARRHWRSGVRPGQLVVNAHPGYLNGGQAIMAGAVEYMGCLSVSIGPPTDDDELIRALRTIEELPIAHWTIMPAAAARIREVATRIGWQGNLPPVEAMTPARQWSAISAGLECIGTLGSTCDAPALRGAHIAEDYAVVEALRPGSYEPVPDGERGTFVCTSLGRDNPTVRYDLQDVIRIDSTPCTCGETSRRAFYDGRLQDVVDVQGKWILPIDVWVALPVGVEFFLLRRGPSADVLDLRIEGAPDPDLVDRLTAQLEVPVAVDWVPDGSLPRAAYKAARVLDEPRT
jgi:phenylacetate-CoA ligase